MQKNDSYFSSIFIKILGKSQKSNLMKRMKELYYIIDGILLIRFKRIQKINNIKKKVLIIYNIALGDGVIFRCSAIHLRKTYPKADYELHLACQKGLNYLYENDNIFDKIIPIDFNKSTVNFKIRKESFEKIRENYYDLVIDPVGISEWTTNIFFTRASLGKEKIGLVDPYIKNYCNMKKINKIYTKIIKLDNKDLSLLEYYSSFFNKLSDKNNVINVGFEKLNIKPNKLDLPNNYYIVFPNASLALKRWHLDRYLYLVKKIYKKTRMPLVILGTNADKETMDLFKESLKVPYIDLFNKTSLNDYIDIINNASLVVTNDTSAYHIALVEQTPVAIITGGYTFSRYVLYDFKRKDEFIKPCIIVHNDTCFNCYNRCPYLEKNNKNWPCLEKISQNYAWNKISKYIDDNKIGVIKK